MLELHSIGVERSIKLSMDRLQNAPDIPVHLVVPKANDAIALLLQPSCAFRIP